MLCHALTEPALKAPDRRRDGDRESAGAETRPDGPMSPKHRPRDGVRVAVRDKAAETALWDAGPDRKDHASLSGEA